MYASKIGEQKQENNVPDNADKSSSKKAMQSKLTFPKSNTNGRPYTTLDQVCAPRKISCTTLTAASETKAPKPEVDNDCTPSTEKTHTLKPLSTRHHSCFARNKEDTSVSWTLPDLLASSIDKKLLLPVQRGRKSYPLMRSLHRSRAPVRSLFMRGPRTSSNRCGKRRNRSKSLCSRDKSNILPTRQCSRSLVSCSMSGFGFRDQTLNNSDYRSFPLRSTPMPELNQNSFISQPQTLSQHIVCGTSFPNMKTNHSARKPGGTAGSLGRLQRSSTMVASHSWPKKSNSGGLFDGLIPEDHPNLLRFERMSLTTCPAINPDHGCHFLSLQRNRITRIDHLQRLTQLVFLDMSHNHVSHISGLDQLTVLRVLLLGHNHIRRIQGLENQKCLEVLDLQKNGIRKIENLSHLTNLRMLNLAMNGIVFVNGLSGMVSLTEVNLRQNNIVRIEPLSNLPNLLWVHLSFNNIERWNQMSGFSGVSGTAKVILDGNPIVMDPSYRRLMPNRCSTGPNRYGQRNTSSCGSARCTSQFTGQQRSLGLINGGGPGTDVYELSQINLRFLGTGDCGLSNGSWQTLQSDTDKSNQLTVDDKTDNSVGDQSNSHTCISSSSGFTSNLITDSPTQSIVSTAVGCVVPTTPSCEECTDIDVIHSQTIDCLEPWSSKSTITVNTLSRTNNNITNHETGFMSACAKSEHTVNRQTMTDQSFLCPQAAIRQMQSIQWVIEDRTHVCLEGKSWSDEACSSHQPDTTGFNSLAAVLNDLASSSKTGERNTPGGAGGTKTTNLTNVTSLTVSHVLWEEFRDELPRIRHILPEMKCLTLKHMGIQRLVDIVALVQLKRLDSLQIDPGPKNPIVRQSGRYWRPFVIWSLKETLGLRELDKIEITPDEVTSASRLFKELGVIFNTHALPHVVPAQTGVTKPVEANAAQEMAVDSVHNLNASKNRWRQEHALHELDRMTQSQSGTVMNQWLEQSQQTRTKKIPQILQRTLATDCDQNKANEHLTYWDDPDRLDLSESALYWLQSAAKRKPVPYFRYLTVQKFVERTLHNTGNRLARETQLMNVWPSILRQLIEREVCEPQRESTPKQANKP